MNQNEIIARDRLKADAAARGAPEYEPPPLTPPPPARPIVEFETGARRDSDHDKLDFESFEHPLVIERFAVYMNKHRTMSNGDRREADDWQLGIPVWRYVKSLVRHVMEIRKWHRGVLPISVDQQAIEESICAAIFNLHGLLFEVLKTRIGLNAVDFTDAKRRSAGR